MAKSQPVLNGVCEGKWRREKKTKDGKIKQYFFLIIDYGCKKQVPKIDLTNIQSKQSIIRLNLLVYYKSPNCWNKI
jgi:hypothetical protein